MIQITDKSRCCGCTACYSACPKNAISMKPDFEGFLYPEINDDLCVDCGLCDKVCPIINKPEPSVGEISTVVLRAKSEETLNESTSGGFMTSLAEWVWENNGALCAVTYDEEFKIVHRIIKKEAGEGEIKKLRGSKYVQSNLNNCFSEIKDILNKGDLVCFVGTTCQVNGLKSYLKKDYENLITVDLVCHGTPSPKLWDKYIEYQKNKYNSEIKSVSFRNKTYGYHSGTMKIEFENGRKYYGSARVDYMLKSFFKEISSRPSCYECAFKTLERCSDFTIYDCWHAAVLVEGLKDDDKGFTNVMIQSDKGKALFDKIKDSYEFYEVDTMSAVKLDGVMVLKSATPHKSRADYYKDIDNESISEHIAKFIPVSKKDYLVENLKSVCYKI